MSGHSRRFWLIPFAAILSFFFGCILGVVLPERNVESVTEPVTMVTTVPTWEPSTEMSLTDEQQLIVDFLKTVEGHVETKRVDLDSDGKEELLLYRNGELNEIAAVQSDAVISLMQKNHLFLCENGIIGQYSEGAGGHTAFFHQLTDGKFRIVECIVYHWHEDAWYRSPDFTANDTTLVPITQEERSEILKKYPYAEELDPQLLQAIYQ